MIFPAVLDANLPTEDFPKSTALVIWGRPMMGSSSRKAYCNYGRPHAGDLLRSVLCISFHVARDRVGWTVHGFAIY